ncbi:MAG: cobalamin-dependent protein [Magnetococcales bacterium]|nr:cobalamin-dependent protein [Magnetococcales bacterium]
MTITLSFADLTHTGKTVDANFFPLGVALVASYAKARLGDAIHAELFKYPQSFSDYIEQKVPDVACFSNYSWNMNLQHNFAMRLKKHHPNIVTIFGGPNFPVDSDEQEEFLRLYPAVDFYVDGEGEIGFVHLLETLIAENMNVKQLKEKETCPANTLYLWNNRLHKGEMLPRIRTLDDIPSPYLSGLLDNFFDDTLFPIIQTARGCPYSCTFCHDGIGYLNKVRRFSQERIRQEIDYVRNHRISPDLYFSDSNFGIALEDQETAQYIKESNRTYGWPNFLNVSTAKNNKDRVLKVSDILGDIIRIDASVQSTNSTVLANIKRNNISLDKMTGIARSVHKSGTKNSSEVILALPGDTKEAHFKSVLDMIDVGIQEVRSFQFILLAGTEAASQDSRKRFAYITRFRVLPRCFGFYKVFGEKFACAETHEVCIGGHDMPIEDYNICRNFDLTVEIFNNGGMFEELLLFLDRHGIKRSTFIRRLFDKAQSSDEIWTSIYQGFRQDEEKNFWKNHADLKSFIRSDDVIKKYISGEYGVNQIFQYRSLAILRNMDIISTLAFGVGQTLLDEAKTLTPTAQEYLRDLRLFIVCAKGNLIDPEQSFTCHSKFDFVKLASGHFLGDPMQFMFQEPVPIQICHTDTKKRELLCILEQFGRSVEGLAHYFQRANIFSLYRQPHYVVTQGHS